MESCAYREFLETVNVKITACGPIYNYPGDENLKDCTIDASRPSPSCQLWLFFFFFFFVFFAKKIQVLVSFRFLTYSYTDPGTSIFCEKKTPITTILTIKNMKSVYLRA